MLPLTLGSPAFTGTAVLWAALRTAMTYVLWAVTAALIAAALCWCCGQGARAAWSRIGPARPGHRTGRRPAGPVPDACEREAARGIRELEIYLAAMSDPR